MVNLSGIGMDDVKVHYDSDKPAQMQALAYAQGTDIHVGPGQEKHLPHEAWHVVQQKQGRVQPTMPMKGGVEVNDDQGLENEADLMGNKSSQAVQQKIDSNRQVNVILGESIQFVKEKKQHYEQEGSDHLKMEREVDEELENEYYADFDERMDWVEQNWNPSSRWSSAISVQAINQHWDYTVTFQWNLRKETIRAHVHYTIVCLVIRSPVKTDNRINCVIDTKQLTYTRRV